MICWSIGAAFATCHHSVVIGKFLTTPFTENQNMSVYDDYTQLSLLGQGSFGKVYKVQSKKDGKYYAMKEINYGQMKEKEK